MVTIPGYKLLVARIVCLSLYQTLYTGTPDQAEVLFGTAVTSKDQNPPAPVGKKNPLFEGEGVLQTVCYYGPPCIVSTWTKDPGI